MNALARWLARAAWRGSLWLMRRPWMKALQRASTRLFPDREKARLNLARQNRIARRIALPLLTASFNLLIASALVTASYFGALELYQSGILTPEKLQAFE